MIQLKALAVSSLLIMSSFSASAAIIYTDKTSFDNALGVNLLTEDFDTETNFAALSGDSDLTSVVSDASTLIFDTPASNGSAKSVGIDDASGTWNTTFTFSQAITAFGIEALDYFEVGTRTLSFTTSAGDSGTLLSATNLGNLNIQYIGFSDAAAFTSITITAIGSSGDGAEFDNIGYALATVPNPSTLLLLAIGLIGLRAKTKA